MDKKYNTMEYNNAIACEVCGGLNFADDYGNSAKCPHCGWQQCGSNETEEKWHGISYPMLVPLSRAREQYKAGKPFKATFEDFINGFNFTEKCYSGITADRIRFTERITACSYTVVAKKRITTRSTIL